MEERINAYKILIGKPEGNRSIGTARRRREDNTKMFFKNGV
jgi:hypothetical protein